MTSPPLARTTAEARLFMDLRACACGARGFAPAASAEYVDDRLCVRYTGVCPQCGAEREFMFLLPEEVILPVGPAFVFGGSEPSQLLDPGEWLAVADLAAAAEPGAPASRDDLRYAAAAVDEVLKFIPADLGELPPGAVRTEVGQAVYVREPERFRRARLAATAAAYRDLAAGAVTG